MKTSPIFRSVVSSLKVGVGSGVSTQSRLSKEMQAAGAKAGDKPGRILSHGLWLGVMLLGGAVVCRLEAQTTVPIGPYLLPVGVAVDGSGNLYIASISKYGGGVYEASDCASGSCVMTTLGGGFYNAWGVAVDENGNIFVADTENSAVKEMPPGCASASCVTTLGGGFSWPYGVAVDGDGNVYVADGKNNAVKEMAAGCTSASCVTTLGGGFNGPEGVAVDARGNIYVSDTGNNAVKEMHRDCDSTACVTTLADSVSDPVGISVERSGDIYLGGNNEARVMPRGCNSSGCVTALGCCFLFSNGVAVDSSGDIYVTSEEGLKEITPGGVNSAAPGGQILPAVDFGAVEVGKAGARQTITFTFSGADKGITASVLTQGVTGLDFTDAGWGSCDTNGAGHRYRRRDTCTVNVMFAPEYAGARYGAVELSDDSGVIATAYVYGEGRGPQLAFGPQPQIALGGGFFSPAGIAVDGGGNVYVANSNSGSGFYGVDVGIYEMPAGCASASCVTSLGGGFGDPTGVAVDGSGNVYVADVFNGVKEMPPGCISSSCVAPLGAGFAYPAGVAVDGRGNVYVGDAAGGVWEMPPGCTSSRCVTSLGGGFDQPWGVAVDTGGNIYVATATGNAVKEMPPGCASASCVTELGGGFSYPDGVAVDASGNIYVSDYLNNEVKVMPPGCTSSTCVTTLEAGFDFPQAVTMDGGGNVYVGDAFSGQVVELEFARPPSFSFVTTSEGSESSDSPQTATLRNIGNGPLRFPVPWTGENPSVSANFTLDPSTTCPEVLTWSSGGELASGASCELAVDFIPTSSGAISGEVVVTDNNLNVKHARQSIDVSGTGGPAPVAP